MDDIFSYLKEEEDLAESGLKELVDGFREKTREEVFDEVKLDCDRLRGYLKKQSALLLDHLKDQGGITAQLKDTVKERDELFADMDNLVMVHVDEPGYQEYLANLLQRSKNYFYASETLYGKLKEVLPKQNLYEINENLRVVIHSDVGFNSLQTPSAPQ
jgi:hypothetical protein